MVSRRLAAIVAADVAGYSRLMHAAEEFTHDRLAHLMSETIGPKVAEHGGRVVKTAGDGFLAEFASAVLAVKCAVEFQDAMRDLTASDPEERRIAFRVGIHIGDVIVEAHDLFGDGVNIAARLEALSDPGGILVSAPVHENVLGRLARAFDDLGELVDARSGAHVWADRFDGTLEDVFDLQDRVTASVVAAIEPKLRSAEIERAQRKPAGNLEAYDLLLRAQPHRYSFTREGLREAERLLRKATEIDPRYALGFAHLAHCLWQLVNQGWMERPDEGDGRRFARHGLHWRKTRTIRRFCR